jgi:hypothetical protein
MIWFYRFGLERGDCQNLIENFIGYSGSIGADKLIDFTVALDKLEK